MSHAYIDFLVKIGVRSAIVLLWLVLGFRLLGKRQMGQMNIYDLAMVMLLANAVQNAMTMGKGEVLVGVVSAGALILLGRLLSALFVRLPKLEERLVGTPTVVIQHGQLVRENMRREHISEDEVMAALRVHGLGDPKDAQLAVLEVDGTLSVVPRDTPFKHKRRPG